MANVGNLATQVEVDELHAVFHLLLLDVVQCFQQFGTVQAELAVVSAGFFPLAATGAGKLDANANVRAHTDATRQFHHQVEFVHLFDDNENLLAHLLRKERQFDKVFVLVAVADNQRIRIVHVREYRMQFRLGTGFETDVVLLAVADDFFQDRALLVYLDWEDTIVASVETVFLAGLVKAFVDLFDAAVQDVRETQQHRSRNIAERKFLHQFVKVNVRTAILERMYRGMALFVDVEVVYAPTLDVVQVAGIVNAPFFHFRFL